MTANAAQNLSASRTSPSVAAIDLADLVSLLVSLETPSREVDNIVEIMAAGDRVIATAAPGTVISSRWLSGETPSYTAGGQALSVLARRRGYRISCRRSGSGYSAEVRNLATGARASAAARIEGAAGVAAIVRLATMEMANA